MPASTPHAPALVPSRQLPVVEMQPLQVNVAQTWFWQDLPIGQLTQAAPALPQALLAMPPRQAPVAGSQQPWQVEGPQPPSEVLEPPPWPLPPPSAPPSRAAQALSTQASFIAHELQFCAPKPQAYC
jgi:hypothetical protein